MTQNYRDLLRKGLTSEYFLASFLFTTSAYGLGQLIQKRSQVNTKTVYPAIQKLKKAGYITEEGGIIHPNLDVLVNMINCEFLEPKRISLTSDEKRFLIKILEDRNFFEKVSGDILDVISSQKAKTHHIDAIGIISDKLGFCASMFLLARSMNQGNEKNTNKHQSLKQIKENFEEMNEIWQHIIPEFEKILSYGLSEIFSNKPYVKKMPHLKGRTNNPRTEETKKLEVDFANQIKKSRSEIKQIRASHQKMPHIESIMRDFSMVIRSIPSLQAFIEVPEVLLLKISKLWKDSEGFEMAFVFFRMQNKKQ